ncbi:uncharacterized protein LOC129236428 [Anastrepha obliqua]|uniref:uncharacterized protein LOC129236428 n=1 Tax=Anastrepha obliqua TaxID=95512 RepID=UPI00240937FC|nr:uncharacterized protein LOC129236428 [Anastrepha obliqua]
MSTKSTLQHFATEDTTTPSPEWLEYQRERFGNTKNIESLKKLLDPSSQLLKNKPLLDRSDQNVMKQEATTNQKDNAHSATTVEQVPNADEPQKAEEVSDDEREEDEEIRSKQESTNIFSYVVEGMQYPSLRGFLNFLKSVQRSWVKQSRLSIEQKINKLKRLKNKMMHLIEDQFNMIWTPKVHMRRKRGLLDESNLNFPPEAALISINFLTFAVFLIKLVLQVVHIIKSKHYTLSGFGFSSADTMTKAT